MNVIYTPYFLALPFSPLYDLKYNLNLVNICISGSMVALTCIPDTSRFLFHSSVASKIPDQSTTYQNETKKKEKKSKSKENTVLTESVKQKWNCHENNTTNTEH